MSCRGFSARRFRSRWSAWTRRERIRNCIYAEAVAELRFVGCDAKATACSRGEIDGFVYVLKRMGFRWLECFVPRKLKKMIQKPLQRAGFTCVDRELAHFTRDLRGKP